MMMKSGLAVVAALSLVGCATIGTLGDYTPPSTTVTHQLSDKERFVAAIEANGCVIDVATIGPIMSQASINQDQLATLTVALENDGVLAPDGTDTVRLSSNNCI